MSNEDRFLTVCLILMFSGIAIGLGAQYVEFVQKERHIVEMKKLGWVKIGEWRKNE